MKMLKAKHLLTVSLLGMSAVFFILACGNTKVDNKGVEPTVEETSQPQQGRTSPFKEGRFKYADAAKFGDFVITRTKDAQIDSGTLTQLVVKFDIEWTSALSYTLRYNSTVSNPQTISLPDLKGMFRNCWMTEVTDTSYTEISTSSLNKDTIRTPIVKI